MKKLPIILKLLLLFCVQLSFIQHSMLAIVCTYLYFVWQQGFYPSQTGLTPNMFNMIQKCKNCQRDL